MYIHMTYIHIHTYVYIRPRAQPVSVKQHSFCVSLCPAKQQQ